MRAAVLEVRGQPLRMEERPDPEPGPGEVRLRVEACGICHGDVSIADGDWEWVPLPRVIGHEVVGIVDRVGPGGDEADIGRRVGVGWMYSSCGHCELCRSHAQQLCRERLITGSQVDGGYGALLVAGRNRIVPVPDGLTSAEAAPLMCAGVSAYMGLLKASPKPGDRIGVAGVGGLGHLAVQFAKAFGGSAVGISRSRAKAADAMALGADHFVAAEDGDVVEQLNDLGGLDIAVVTGTDASILGALVAAMRPGGALVVLASDNDIVLSPVEMCLRQLRVYGSQTGTVDDEAEMLAFCAERGIKPMIEEFAIEDCNEALARVRSGQVRYRAVLVH